MPARSSPGGKRVSVSTMLLWTALLSILGAGGAAGYYAYQVLYENKLTDTWAIMFLELERQGNELSQKLEQFARTRSDSLPGLSDRALAERAERNLPDLILRLGKRQSAGNSPRQRPR